MTHHPARKKLTIPRDLVTAEQLAKVLKRSRCTIHDLTSKGIIPIFAKCPRGDILYSQKEAQHKVNVWKSKHTERRRLAALYAIKYEKVKEYRLQDLSKTEICKLLKISYVTLQKMLGEQTATRTEGDIPLTTFLKKESVSWHEGRNIAANLGFYDPRHKNSKVYLTKQQQRVFVTLLQSWKAGRKERALRRCANRREALKDWLGSAHKIAIKFHIKDKLAKEIIKDLGISIKPKGQNQFTPVQQASICKAGEEWKAMNPTQRRAKQLQFRLREFGELCIQ